VRVTDAYRTENSGEVIINDQRGRRPPGIAVVRAVSVISVF